MLHAGSRRHGADNIASGMRANLVLCSSSSIPQYDRSRSSEQRAVSEGKRSPDPVCVSYTHDRDFIQATTGSSGQQRAAAAAEEEGSSGARRSERNTTASIGC